MAQNINRSEFINWKRDRCTTLFMQSLDDNCKMIMNNWSQGAYAPADPQVASIKNAEMLGQVAVLKSILQAFQENKVIAFVEDEELDA